MDLHQCGDTMTNNILFLAEELTSCSVIMKDEEEESFQHELPQESNPL